MCSVVEKNFACMKCLCLKHFIRHINGACLSKWEKKNCDLQELFVKIYTLKIINPIRTVFSLLFLRFRVRSRGSGEGGTWRGSWAPAPSTSTRLRAAMATTFPLRSPCWRGAAPKLSAPPPATRTPPSPSSSAESVIVCRSARAASCTRQVQDSVNFLSIQTAWGYHKHFASHSFKIWATDGVLKRFFS